jgi:ATP-dependent DNA helicase MPH1
MNESRVVELSEDSENAFSDTDSEFERILNENEPKQENKPNKPNKPNQGSQPNQLPRLDDSIKLLRSNHLDDHYGDNSSFLKFTSSTHHRIDYNELSKYIYPINFELRDYQYNIVRKAFYDNLLVALPTGLGKTFIASTVILNFGRWFPDSKLIFMAPTRPLVAQQLKACCSIAGVPATKVAILLDKSRKNRQQIWDSKLVFFTTPQVVENDLASGVLHPKSIALLVIDEAHRARGNYAYHNVVKFLNRFNNSYRIIALTATPASDIEGVQEIIDNLLISKVEVRTENSIDIIKYMKRKRLVRRIVPTSNNIETLINYLSEAIAPVLKTANDRKVLDITVPLKINFYQCMEASRKIAMNPSIPEALKWSNVSILQLLGIAGQCLRKLNFYGIKSFHSYFSEKYLEFTTKHNAKKLKNKASASFYLHPAIPELLKETERILNMERYSHPKMEVLMEELEEFFTINNNNDSRVIIFTEFRESALEIVQLIEKSAEEASSGVIHDLKPHIFIGQSKEKEKFDEAKYLSKLKRPKKSKSSDVEEPRNTNRTSSEDAQTKGMNQKLQKQIIKQFKDGVFNILVATSIGEEGLDIGEVDLIICYDSTASPIKNIQRMGRTGRKREGKVVLLFSGNEESKFDKAMGGYEYIQQHIMKGELIKLAHSNRMLPADFEPEVVQQIIEMPNENLELKQVEDEDEIIKIATQYMLKTTSDKRKNSKPQKKAAKKFFVPDNVELSFRSVKSMLKGNTQSTQSQTNSKKTSDSSSQERSVLESILYSDEDDDFDADELTLPSTDNINSSNVNNSSTYPTSSAEISTFEHTCTPSETKKRRLLDDIITLAPKIESTSDTISHTNKRPQVRSAPKYMRIEPSHHMNKSGEMLVVPRRKTLGAKRVRNGSIGITDLLKDCQARKLVSNEVITIEDDAIIDIPSYIPMLALDSDQGLKKEELHIDDGEKHLQNSEKHSHNEKHLENREKHSDNREKHLHSEKHSHNEKRIHSGKHIHYEKYLHNENINNDSNLYNENPFHDDLHIDDDETSCERRLEDDEKHLYDRGSAINDEEVRLGEDDDMFDDGLDEELALISSNTISMYGESVKGTQMSQQSQIISDTESLYKNEFEPRDGLLNDDQKMELYTSYFSCVPVTNGKFDPYESLQGENDEAKGVIGHSKVTNGYKNLLEFNSKINDFDAKILISRYNNLTSLSKTS